MLGTLEILLDVAQILLDVAVVVLLCKIIKERDSEE